MTTIVQEAIEALKELPEDKQTTVARAILDYAAHDEDLYHLTDDERSEIHAGVAEIDCGETASDAEVHDLHKRIGL